MAIVSIKCMIRNKELKKIRQDEQTTEITDIEQKSVE